MREVTLPWLISKSWKVVTFLASNCQKASMENWEVFIVWGYSAVLRNIPPPGFVSDVIPCRKRHRALIAVLKSHSSPVLRNLWCTSVCSYWVSPKSSLSPSTALFHAVLTSSNGGPHPDSWSPIAFWHWETGLLNCWITAFSYRTILSWQFFTKLSFS